MCKRDVLDVIDNIIKAYDKKNKNYKEDMILAIMPMVDIIETLAGKISLLHRNHTHNKGDKCIYCDLIEKYGRE